MRSTLSTLAAAGRDAEEITQLFWWMVAGGGLLWIAMVIATLYCWRGPRTQRSGQLTPFLIVGGGVVLPTLVLFALLLVGLPPIARLTDGPQGGHIVIDAAGEQWWWRIRYLMPSGVQADLANEIRLPVGERIEVRLSSDNVIHSFWIPSISGKVDMIPGRTTHLSLEPTRTGTFRGACAEYCGTSHALMAFGVEVLEKDDFARWIAAQAEPARDPQAPLATAGRDHFTANGCGACHTVRGTSATGRIGPDLTHVGSRTSLGAGTMPNEAERMVDWIADPGGIKPDVHMPGFGMLPGDQLQAIAAYLSSLE